MNRKYNYPLAAAAVSLGLLFVLMGGGFPAQAQYEMPEPGEVMPELMETDPVMTDILEAGEIPPQGIDETNTFPPGEWVYEVVDSAGNVGNYSSLELDSAGYPHTSYYDSNNGDLKYAYQDPAGWHIEIVDVNGGTNSSLQLDGQGYPHILYNSGTSIKYAYKDASNWNIESVTGSGSSISIALDDFGNPHISYLSGQLGFYPHYLKYGIRTNGAWSLQDIDTSTTSEPLGPGTSIAVDQYNHPHITFAKRRTYSYPPMGSRLAQSLKYAFFDGSAWHISSLAIGGCGSTFWEPPDLVCYQRGSYSSLRLSSSDAVRVSFYTFRQSLRSSSQEYLEAIPGGALYDSGIDPHSSLALDSADSPYVSYISNGDLKLASRSASQWDMQVVDSQGDIGVYTSLELDSNDNPIITYYDATNGDLKIARYITHGIFLSPELQLSSATRGATVGYQITLHNQTEATDSFTLEFGPHTWETIPSANPVGPVPAGSSVTVDLSVRIPDDAAWYSTDSVAVIARSQNDPSQTSNASQLNTQAYAPPQISVSPTGLDIIQSPEQANTQQLTIGNGNGITLTYAITGSLSSNPDLIFHLDEPAGDSFFAENSGNEYHASCTGTSCPVAGEAGAVGLALDFDGSDDYIQVAPNGPVDSIENQDKLTLAAWVKIKGWDNGKFPIFDEYESSGDFGWNFEIIQPGSLVLNTDPTNQTICAATLPLNTWQHVAVTYDRSKSQAIFYVNGKGQCTNSFDKDIPQIAADALLIGYSHSGDDEFTNGQIDELVVYHQAILPSEVSALYQYPSVVSDTWLSYQSASGNLQSNSTSPVQVNISTVGLQPGSYLSTINILNNDPAEPVLNVPVMLTVTTPASWGKIGGMLTGQGYCDENPAPLRNWEFQLQTSTGLSWTLMTDADGNFQAWLPSGLSPIGITVNAQDQSPATADGIVISPQQMTIKDFNLRWLRPCMNLSSSVLNSTQLSGQIVTQKLTISNSADAPLGYQIAPNLSPYFMAVSTQLYGHEDSGGVLRIIATQDHTAIRLIDLDTHGVIAENPDMDRYEYWDVTPGARIAYKVESNYPVLGYKSDFSGYGNTTFYPSLETGPVGKEFIIYFHCGDTLGDYCYVFATQDSAVQIFNPSGNLVASKSLLSGQFWTLSLPNGVYHVRSSGRIAIESTAEYGFTTVPSIDSNTTGLQFYFATHYLGSGAFVVYAYQDAEVRVYDLNTGALQYIRSMQRGDYWWQTGVGTRQLRLDSTGLVEVWAGSTLGGTNIENLGDDLSSTTGDRGKEFFLHSLAGGSILYAPFGNTSVNIDGSIIQIDADDYYPLPGCCTFHHLQSTLPILVDTLGFAGGLSNYGTYLGGGSLGTGTIVPWLQVNQNPGTVFGNGAQEIQVTFNAVGLQPGVYTTVLYLATNDPEYPRVTIAVQMEVRLAPDYTKRFYLPLIVH